MNSQSLAGKLDAYRDVGVVGSVAEADAQKLILLVMDGALEAMLRAHGFLERGDVPAKADALSKAVRLVDALRAFLDHEEGGDMAASLEQLYDYIARRLATANARNQPELIVECSELLRGLRDTWAQVPELLSAPEAAGA
ncbi:MAG: flagellar export chaperone FliS [Gammaproteobacteria bacterium]|nr:flagellar export chaperone FliS [Gammaproteobacteria bacterium]